MTSLGFLCDKCHIDHTFILVSDKVTCGEVEQITASAEINSRNTSPEKNWEKSEIRSIEHVLISLRE